MSIFLKANWENIIMANYAVPKEILMPYLPKGVELDLYNGEAYVSLVGFMFKNTKIFNIPIPYFGTFEEINLRFYVTRKEGDEVKRGVVFINETIPYKIVAWMANKLYKEHYTTIPTRHKINVHSQKKEIQFEWRLNNSWNAIFVEASNEANSMKKDSFESYIFEHYFGYTKVSESDTEEYTLQHPSWMIHKIFSYKIDCDFGAMYGNEFAHLSSKIPESIFIAKGSNVAINWKRNKIAI